MVGLLPSKQSAGVRFPSGAFFCGSALLYFLCIPVIEAGRGTPRFFSSRDTIIQRVCLFLSKPKGFVP